MKVLEGFRVVEVANWLAAPLAGAILADLGAEVIKVERPGGDPWRYFPLSSFGYSGVPGVNALFHQDNRGKRSIVVDLTKPGAGPLIADLVESADVFLTNLLPHARQRYGLTYEDLSARNPRLIYAGLTGYGDRGPDRDRQGFDHSAFWTRSGIMALMGSPDSPPVAQRGGIGDRSSAMALATGILAALLARERSGVGQKIEASLFATGLWAHGTDVAPALLLHEHARRSSRTHPPNPIWNFYRTRDGQWLSLTMPPFEMYWARVAQAIGRPEVADDPAYCTLQAITPRIPDVVRMLDEIIGSKTLDEWAAILDAHGLVWTPIPEMTSVVADRQAREMGYFAPIEVAGYGQLEVTALPFQLDRSPARPRRGAPGPGDDTDAVLKELRYDPDHVRRLHESGTVAGPSGRPRSG